MLEVQMSVLLVIMILISSLLHVIWNMLGKKGTPSAAFFLGTSATAVLVFLPVYTVLFPFSEVPGKLWLYMIASGFFQTVYYIGLGTGYRSGELSYVYPLARALPVLLIPLISIMLRIGVIYSVVNGMGMVLVFSGCVLLPFEKGNMKRALSMYLSGGFLFAVLAAAGTTGYTLVDSTGVRQLAEFLPYSTTSALVSVFYLSYEMLFAFIFLLMYVGLVKKEKGYFLDIIRSNKFRAFVSGIILLLAYGIILVAYTMFESVSYIAAFRQMSIPLGVISGIVLLKERQNYGKIVGSLIIFTGLVLVYV